MVQPSAGVEQEHEHRRNPGGRPWPKGVSGNPSGSKVSKRVTILFETLADEFDLSATDRALLMQACRLLVRSERVKDARDAVKCANAARRILAGLRREQAGAGSPPWSPLRAQLARSQQTDAVIAETQETAS
jgi:hypothetical protein